MNHHELSKYVNACQNFQRWLPVVKPPRGKLARRLLKWAREVCRLWRPEFGNKQTRFVFAWALLCVASGSVSCSSLTWQQREIQKQDTQWHFDSKTGKWEVVK